MIIPKGENILKYLQKQNINIVAPCNGNGICGKCKVKIGNNPVPNKTELALLSDEELAGSVRLACTRTAISDLHIELLNEYRDMNITSTFNENYEKKPFVKLVKAADGYEVLRGEEKVAVVERKAAYGMAIDIGTTTVVVTLVDLVNLSIIDMDAFMNPQSKYGSDVISRIQFAHDAGNLRILSGLIRKALDHSIDSLLKRNGISRQYLFEVAIAANTTMVHLLLEMDPTSIALAPYVSNCLDQRTLNYQDLFESSLPAKVTVMGGFDAFVGGDILSGIYSEDLHKKEEYNLLVDLGTNGEIALIRKGYVFATSTAAGPAFEGINIYCGIGAVSGAISKFFPDGKFETINNALPIGICGSGLIDIVSELLKAGIIDPSGRMKQEYIISGNIKIIPKDIREIQLAKAAIRAGVEHLLEDAEVKTDQISHLYIAGGFGKNANLDHFFDLGMFPRELRDKTIVIGNSSLSGVVKFLFSPLSNELKEIKKNSRVVDLGSSKRFQDLFIENIHFDLD